MNRWLPLAAYLLAVVLAAFFWRTDLLSTDSNRVANELAQNGLSSFVRAALTNEIDYQANYKSHEPKDNLAIVTRELERGGGKFTRLAEGRLDRAFPARPDGLGWLNVVLVSSESFGAEFSRLYGSERDLTPNFDAFAQKGVWFSHAYASGTRTVRGLEALVTVMLQVTNYVMRTAPLAVFAAVAGAIAERGPVVLATYGKFVASFYFGLALLWAILILFAFVAVGKRVSHLLRYIRDPIVLAFSTASSEAAYPRTLEALERFGVAPRIASFVLPLGYSFNLDGSMMYMTFASIFIAQIYGIDLTLMQMVTMLMVLMITSKGMAGVPRASLVVIAATLSMFHIPEAGIGLILAVDHFLDMGRSATNVVGNAVAATLVAKWEGALDAPLPPDIEPPHAPSHRPPLPPGSEEAIKA